jgi:hypothetical protein
MPAASRTNSSSFNALRNCPSAWLRADGLIVNSDEAAAAAATIELLEHEQEIQIEPSQWCMHDVQHWLPTMHHMQFA